MNKILFFIQNGVGGAERMTINIAKLLSKERWNRVICKVTVPLMIQNGKIDTFIPSDIKITNIANISQISFLCQLIKSIRYFKPQIIFCSVMPYNQRLLLLAPFFKKIKFIVRNDNYLYTIGRFKRLTLKYTYSFADKIIAQTEEMKNELINLGINEEKIITLHNFIDTNLIKSKAEESSPFTNEKIVRFVSVGRLAYQKGFDILIKAFKLVTNLLPDAQLYIIGNCDGEKGKVYSELTQLIKDLSLTDQVHFIGYSDNPYKYIKNASVYVLSSRYEGLPNVLIEAQFLQTPIAATECIPMISRMITDGKNGYKAATENPESLADAMIKASKMRKVIPVYKSSDKEDFINLFNL